MKRLIRWFFGKRPATRRGNSWGGGQPATRSILWTAGGHTRVLQVAL